MQVLLSNWPSSTVQSLPENYVFPPDRRPGTLTVPLGKDVPVIDLQKTVGPDRAQTIQQILEACQGIGLFQVVNHGVSGELMDESMKLLKEFFNMSAEDKAKFIKDARDESCILYSSSLKHDNNKMVHYWKDCFTHHCNPLQDHLQNWPEKPTNYREVVGTYAVEVRRLLQCVLDLISEGLGITEPGYFEGDLSSDQLLSVNHHIPCPDPSLTLGHPEHYDPNLITALHQCDVPGLQLLMDAQWVGVETIPHAFVVFPGAQLRVISNGRFKNRIHRVVTHAEEPRTTIGYFFIPSDDALVEPAKDLLSPSNPPRYKSYRYGDFFADWSTQVTEEAPLQRFKL